MPERNTLYVCHLDEKIPMLHPCAKAHAALADAGHDVDKKVYGKGQPFGIGVKGKRPDLQEMSGQEKLPVLQLADGKAIAGSKAIIAWAKGNAPGAPAPPAAG